MADPKDNTNKGALWPCRGFNGKVDIGGKVLYLSLVESCAKSDKAPKYYAIVRGGDGTNGEIVPVWRTKKEGSAAVANFTYGEYAVCVFVNKNKDGSPLSENAPKLHLSAIHVAEESAPSGGVKGHTEDPDFGF
jgi:hypothetical protein